MKISSILLFLPFAFVSCFEEDEPVPPYVSPKGVSTVVAEIGPDYGHQLFYDLGTNSFAAPVHRESWDLAFSSQAGDPTIRLNGAKLMKAFDLGQIDFASASLPAGELDWRIDSPSGSTDSLAIGDWGILEGNRVVSKNHVYIIDLGFTTAGQTLGRKKLQILGYENGAFSVRFGDLQDPIGHSFDIEQDNRYSFQYLSLHGQGSLENVAPPKEDWDLMFSQYTGLVFNSATQEKESYSVNGVLLNPYAVQAAMHTDLEFDSIDYTALNLVAFTNKWDAIGYDWKEYDFDISGYYIATNRIYFVQDVEGSFYALRFISFVNDLGERGYPTFELRKL